MSLFALLNLTLMKWHDTLELDSIFHNLEGESIIFFIVFVDEMLFFLTQEMHFQKLAH